MACASHHRGRHGTSKNIARDGLFVAGEPGVDGALGSEQLATPMHAMQDAPVPGRLRDRAAIEEIEALAGWRDVSPNRLALGASGYPSESGAQASNHLALRLTDR